MKAIAVLTDLATNAEHTTQFALHMAKKMRQNVILYQVQPVPSIKQPVLVGDEEQVMETEPELVEFGRKMALTLANRSFPGSYLPEVLVNCDSADIVDVMTNIMGNNQISLVVTAPASEQPMEEYLMSDTCNRIIDWATTPVLVVPQSAPLRNFEKIAFASQLHEEDINAIAELGNLLESFSPELMVAHLNCNPLDETVRNAENKLNSDLYKKLNCGGIYFRSIPDDSKQKNWDWLKANKKTELLAVAQQTREKMTKFFKRGYNQSVTYHLTTPVVVLPKRP